MRQPLKFTTPHYNQRLLLYVPENYNHYYFTPKHKEPAKLSPRLNEKCHPMARPIPVEDISKLTEEIKPKDTKSFIDITINGIKNKSTKNLLIGTVAGWLAGVGCLRVGKVAAFGLGGGVLILHFASEGGYIHVNWERVREAAAQSEAYLEMAVKFVKRNSCLSVGFAGGFLFGVAWA